MKSPFSHHVNREIGPLDRLCLRAIAWYQRELSPRKGYRCAHARLHDGVGCSGFARAAIERHGLCSAASLVRARFRDCNLAGQTLRAHIELSKSGDSDETEADRSRRNKRDWRNQFSDVCCVDFSWVCCADSLCDGSACEAASCADASCAHGACADASCADAACGCHSCL